MKEELKQVNPNSIIIFDSYDKTLLDDTIDSVTSYLSNFILKKFQADKKNFYESTFSFFEKLIDKNYIVKESFYTPFVESMLGRSYSITSSDLRKLERIQLFYFFIEAKKPKTIKEIQKWDLYNYSFHKSNLPIKIKIDLNNYEKSLIDFKEQYVQYIIKVNPYLIVSQS